MSVSRTEHHETTEDNSIYSPWPNALKSRPDEPIYDKTGAYSVNSFNNPVQGFEPDMNVKVSKFLNTSFAEIKLLKGLSFKSVLGIDYSMIEGSVFNPIKSFDGASANRSATSSISRRLDYVLTQSLTYQKSFFDNNLYLNALGVYEYQDNSRDKAYITKQNFPSDITPSLKAGSKVNEAYTNWKGSTLESLLARVNLSWKNKYLLGASIRRDGSSRFPKSGRYGVFPSISLGWNISEEDFMKNKDLISSLKLKSSFGETGNQSGIDDFGYLKTYGAGYNYEDQAGFALKRLGNKDLKWETTSQVDVGLNIGVLNDRILIESDYYVKKTKDLLLYRPIPATAGFGSRLENIGSMRGKGFDFSINTVNLNGELNWTSTLTLSTYNNKITKLYNDQPINGGFATRQAVGHAMGSYFLIKALGVDPNTGDMKYEDIAGNPDGTPDGKITDADRQFLGSPLPKVFGGLNNSLKYKNFDLNVFFQFALGNHLYKMYEEDTGGAASLGAAAVATNVLKKVWDGRWTKKGQYAKYPRAVAGTKGTFNSQRSSRFLENASYLRLKNITLGYTIPEDIVKKAKLQSLRLYVSGSNLLTITNYTGFDPEVSTENTVRNLGVDLGAIPQMKSVQFGLSATF